MTRGYIQEIVPSDDAGNIPRPNFLLHNHCTVQPYIHIYMCRKGAVGITTGVGATRAKLAICWLILTNKIMELKKLEWLVALCHALLHPRFCVEIRLGPQGPNLHNVGLDPHLPHLEKNPGIRQQNFAESEPCAGSSVFSSLP